MGDWSMRMTLSIWSTPLMRLVLAGLFARAVELLGQRAIENVVDQGALAGAGDAGDDRHDAEREAGGEVLQIVAARALDRDPFARERARRFGAMQDADRAGEIAAGERRRACHDVLRGALGDDVAAELAGAGAEVET